MRAGLGLFAPSMGLTPSRCALRGQRVALSKFVPDEFVERVRFPDPPSQKQKARREGGLFVFGWETRIRT